MVVAGRIYLAPTPAIARLWYRAPTTTGLLWSWPCWLRTLKRPSAHAGMTVHVPLSLN